jgi:predicted ATP-grasp superfamily ATP-dependent carboligase
VQEIIPGLASKNIFGIEAYLDINSRPLALFAHVRARGWPPIFGNTCLRESISPQDISVPLAHTLRYLKNIGYYGIVEAEWKWDHRNKLFKLLEINPRQSMQSSLSARCGANFILSAYLDCIGKRIINQNEYLTGIRWVNFCDDLCASFNFRIPVNEWFASLKNVKEWSIFASDDMLPWLIQSLMTIRNWHSFINQLKLADKY